MLRVCCFLLMVMSAFAPPGRVRGKVVDLQGIFESGDPPQPDAYIVRTDAADEFQIDAIEPGTYEAEVAHDGYEPQHGTLTVRPRQYVRDFVLRLSPIGVITGRVLDALGDPVADATVSAVRYENGPESQRSWDAARCRTGKLGRYRLFDLPRGSYVVQVWPLDRNAGGTSSDLLPGGAPWQLAPEAAAAAPKIEVRPGELLQKDVHLK